MKMRRHSKRQARASLEWRWRQPVFQGTVDEVIAWLRSKVEAGHAPR